MAALAGEADMPLEQLLAMYGMVIDEDQAGKQDSAGDSVKEASELGLSRPSKRRRLAPGEMTDNISASRNPAQLIMAALSSVRLSRKNDRKS